MLLGRVKKDIKLLGEKSEIARLRVRKEVRLLNKRENDYSEGT